MRKFLFFVFLICTSIQFVSAQTGKKNDHAKASLLRHVVMFKFKDNATSQEVKKIEGAFRALAGKIKQIKDFEWGVNSSPEKLNQGLTHCFFVTFHSAKDRDAYLIHPAHMEFVDILKPYFDKATVLDYWAHK